MRNPAARRSRRALVVGLAALGAACSSGGGHTPAPPPPDPCTFAPALPAGQAFTISGKVVYDFVPAVYDPSTGNGGLAFALTEQRPVRGADVEIRQCGNVLARATTKDAADATAGTYSATFTPGAQGQILVYVLARTASPPIQVVDNTAAGAIWTVAQPVLSASPTLDVHATHGWANGAYVAARIAAPFAILDSMYTAAHALLDIPRAIAFDGVLLVVNWSPANSFSLIDTSHYDPRKRQIWILGQAGVDTDEFDREVIVHEWGHYLQDNFSRSDTPGGSHGFGDVLDPRLAFDEGFASALAAMVLQQTVYADTYWNGGAQDAFGWNVETAPPPSGSSGSNPADDPNPGPFSELSVIRAVWDLYDAPTTPGSTTEAWDGISTGLAPIFDTLVGPERTTQALTTIASFVAGLKGQPGVIGTAVDAVLLHYQIGPITSEWGNGDPGLSGMYTDVPAPSSTPYATTATFDGQYLPNERAQNQYYVFTATGTHATVTASSSYDVDLYAYASGTLLASDEQSYSQSPTADIAFSTTPGTTYVVVLTGNGGLAYGNTGVGAYTATVTFSN